MRIVALLRTLEGHTDCVTDVVLSSDGQVAVSASRDRTLRVWDVPGGSSGTLWKGILEQFGMCS